MSDFVIALSCLTVLPVGPRGAVPEAALGRSFLWFPVVGLLLGAALAGLSRAAMLVWPPLAASALVVLAWVAVTGALHLDGLADVCDGLAGGTTPEDRLQIMKDPHVGAFAVVGVACLVLGKLAFLGSLPAARLMNALVIAPCLARYAMALLGTILPSARPTGTAAPFVRSATPQALAGATAITLIAVVALRGLSGLLLFGLIVGAAWLLGGVFRRTLGGITGDALGAAGECIELLTLAVMAAGP